MAAVPHYHRAAALGLRLLAEVGQLGLLLAGAEAEVVDEAAEALGAVLVRADFLVQVDVPDFLHAPGSRRQGCYGMVAGVLAAAGWC